MLRFALTKKLNIQPIGFRFRVWPHVITGRDERSCGSLVDEENGGGFNIKDLQKKLQQLFNHQITVVVRSRTVRSITILNQSIHFNDPSNQQVQRELNSSIIENAIGLTDHSRSS
jgi:hypothetical protein